MLTILIMTTMAAERSLFLVIVSHHMTLCIIQHICFIHPLTLQGCATDDPIKGLYKYENDIQGGITLHNEFSTQTDQIGIDKINEQCGVSTHPIICARLITDTWQSLSYYRAATRTMTARKRAPMKHPLPPKNHLLIYPAAVSHPLTTTMMKSLLHLWNSIHQLIITIMNTRAVEQPTTTFTK